MYTGITRGVFPVVAVERHAGHTHFTVQLSPELSQGVGIGASVAIDGVCCTVVLHDGVQLGFDETVQRFIGSSVPATLQRVAALLGRDEPPPGFFNDFSRRTQAAFRAGLRTVPGVESVLAALSHGADLQLGGD